jgi:hypothetical protein
VNGQITSGLIMLGLLFLLPGVLLAIGIAMFMRHYNRFRSWIRITLILTVLGSAMWIVAVRYLNVDVGSLQMGVMASVVAVFSLILAGIAVWVVPRKKVVATLPDIPAPEPERAIKIKGFDA